MSYRQHPTRLALEKDNLEWEATQRHPSHERRLCQVLEPSRRDAVGGNARKSRKQRLAKAILERLATLEPIVIFGLDPFVACEGLDDKGSMTRAR